MQTDRKIEIQTKYDRYKDDRKICRRTERQRYKLNMIDIKMIERYVDGYKYRDIN